MQAFSLRKMDGLPQQTAPPFILLLQSAGYSSRQK